MRATNSAALDGVWASSSQSFSTPASTNPVVANGAVINASGSQVTLLGKVISPGNGTINQGSANFTANRYDSLMLWLDANDSSTLDQGYASGETGVPNTNESVGYWADKSGKDIMQLPTVSCQIDDLLTRPPPPVFKSCPPLALMALIMP